MNNMVKKIVVGNLKTHFYATRDDMGRAAAQDGGEFIVELLKNKDYVNVIFAAAPSQNETLKYLIEYPGIDWTRVRAFHMDEYVGLDSSAPQCFGNFLNNAIFSKLPFKEVHYLSEFKDSDTICKEYSELLKKYPVDIVFMGIGENAHIAFNDPHVADFNDEALVKLVSLDETCRQQQVNDGCFAKIDDVPTHAVTLTVPALCAAKKLICTVPASTKANAVVKTMYAPIDEAVPATIMRLHDDATMYVDADSGAKAIFQTSVITDEISQDFEVACQLASHYGLQAVEIRSVWETAPEKLTNEQIDLINSIVLKYSLKISCICSGILKCKQGEENDEQFIAATEIANKLNCKMIRGFTHFEDVDYSEDVLVVKLREYSDILRKNGMYMAIENEPSVNASSGEKLSHLLEKVDRDNIGALWDPGNNLYGESEIAYPDGYEHIKNHVRHVHLKDAVRSEGETQGVAWGNGELDCVGQLAGLIKNDYNGYIVLEPHYKKNGGAIDKELLLRPFGSAFSQGGYESTEECIVNLFDTISKAIKSVK